MQLETAGDVYEGEFDRARLARVNRLMQIPTLVLPGGEVVTESAAMTLLLAGLAQSDDLVPGPGAPDRAAIDSYLAAMVRRRPGQALSSARMARAAAAGSRDCQMGRPTTM